MSQASFQKRMREKQRQEKAEAKRQRKVERAAEAQAAADEPAEQVVPQDVILAKLAALHQRFDDDQIDFDEFEERKQELMAELAI